MNGSDKELYNFFNNLTHFLFSVIVYITYRTGVVDCFWMFPRMKPKTQMPEIKPVEPDPDNAGVGNK
jgi:hypothetical protein